MKNTEKIEKLEHNFNIKIVNVNSREYELQDDQQDSLGDNNVVQILYNNQINFSYLDGGLFVEEDQLIKLFKIIFGY